MHSDKNARDGSRLGGLAGREFRAFVFDHISRSDKCYAISAPRDGTSYMVDLVLDELSQVHQIT